MVELIEAIGNPVDGNQSDFELSILMVSALSLPIGARVFEFGTFEGRSSANIARCLRGGLVFTLDLPKDIKPEGTGENEKYFHHDLKYRSDGVLYIYANSMAFDFSPFHNQIDMVFVDGNHSSPFVESDIENAFKIMKVGGLIWCHDYDSGWPDVKRVIDSRAEDWKVIKGTSLATCRKI